jgi:cytochrome bd ubiquinol oxidase subunit II
METLWFWLVAIMIAAYVILDGFDLGAGILHLAVARTDEERKSVLQSIGPFWDGNEVWLLAGGGTLYFAFPALYASSFSGFYLPLMMVLWLLILRGISIELRGHFDSPVWKPFWDGVFCLASALLAIFLGAALGNVIRGVSLNQTGEFFLPLWTHFGVRGEVGILDWYTITVAVLAFVTLAHHGGLWVAYKTRGMVEARARRIAAAAWWGVAILTVATTIVTFGVQPQVAANLASPSWGYVFPALALGGLAAAFAYRRQGTGLRAFLGSCLYIAGMLGSAAFGIYPYVLPSNQEPNLGLTIYNTASAHYGLVIGLVWWIPGVILAAGYFVYIHRQFAGKVEESAAYGSGSAE